MGGPSYKRNPSLRDLVKHPSFQLPKLPSLDNRNINNILDYVTEYIARVVSPSPQLDYEDEEIACTSLAKIIRTEIRQELKKNLRNTGRVGP